MLSGSVSSSQLSNLYFQKASTPQSLESTKEKQQVPSEKQSVSVDSKEKNSLFRRVVDYDKQISLIKSGGAPLMRVNFKEIMSQENGFEIAARAGRLRDSFSSESEAFHEQAKEVVRQGEESGKSGKQIWGELSSLFDKQSELFRLGSGFEGTLLTDKSNYSTLVSLTSDYINVSA